MKPIYLWEIQNTNANFRILEIYQKCKTTLTLALCHTTRQNQMHIHTICIPHASV